VQEESRAVSTARLGAARYQHDWEIGQREPLDRIVAAVLAFALDQPTTWCVGDDAGQATLPHPGFGLTPREREVLRLLCQHQTNAQIGATLFISERTAENHVASILGKLQARNRREVVATAARHSLVERHE
jgi:DNA-binding CsgD family transcriptional regulator